MKNIKIQSVLLLTVLLIATACGSSKSGDQEEAKDSTQVATKKYKIYKAPPSQAYPDAALEMTTTAGKEIANETTFSFDVTNYELGIQTPDAADRGIANSSKGQHIHFILNNDPYSAHYDPKFIKDLPDGKHVVLAFLSRSYHEAVKEPKAYVLREITVGSAMDSSTFDPSAQHLFYSRPKGTYSGTDTEKLMLDFFLFNTMISPDGNKVRATINAEEYMITEWAPYYIEGLGKGEVTIKLELIDSNGEVIPGPYNTVTRKVTLE